VTGPGSAAPYPLPLRHLGRMSGVAVPDRARALGRQRVRAVDLLADGIVSRVIPERAGVSCRDQALAITAEVARVLAG